VHYRDDTLDAAQPDDRGSARHRNTARSFVRTVVGRACGAGRGDRTEASRLAGCDLTGFPDEEQAIVSLRPNDLTADPTYLPWSLRAIALKPALAWSATAISTASQGRRI
jgi:hypothetical protein